jgi:hypothetical protein
MMPDGRILFVGIARPTDPGGGTFRRAAWIFTPPAPGTPIPAQTTISELAEPAEFTSNPFGPDWVINDDLECMGSVLDAHGRVVTAGGTRQIVGKNGAGYLVYGIPYLTSFDGTTWTRIKPMVGNGSKGTPGRWYPTLTRLPDGKILITGGLEVINALDPAKMVGVPNSTLETYDPDSGAQRVVSTIAQTPVTIHAGDYTHAFVLPWPGASKDLLMFGEQGLPIFGKSDQAGSYQAYPLRRPGGDEKVNYGTSTVALPFRLQARQWGYGNGSVLAVSGNMHTVFEHSADLFDPSTASWRSPSIDLGFARHHPSTVLLPDGRILVLNGHDMEGGTGVMQAQYIDPRNGFSVATGTGSSGVIRGYHSVAVLLPDGRVLVAGGRDQNRDTSKEKPTWQIYAPTYPSGRAPALVDGPANLAYGASFQYSSVGPAPAEIVLIGLAAMTHSFDMNEREIQLAITKTYSNASGAHLNVVQAPANSHVAPPGHYWLFAVSAAGVPSKAKLVRIG